MSLKPIVVFGQFTSAEAEFLANLAGLTYANGDILYASSGDLTNLAVGAPGQVLQVSAGNIPEWATVSGTGDVTAAAAFANDNRLIRSDGAAKGVQASPVVVSDLGAVSGVPSITLDASGSLLFGAVTILSDAAGTTTLSNIDALDATTEATIEAAIDTLANLVSIQGLTVTLADAGADALLGWDDSASAYQNLSAADVRTALGLVIGTNVQAYDADLTTWAGITPGTGVATALAVNVGTAGAFLVNGGVLGTPSSGTVTNLTGTASININGTVGATTPTTATFTVATINTGLIPDANDGAYLGTTTAQWSDLFLAEGGVINWDNGDATLTQTGNVLALAGADFQVATAGVGTNADSVPTLSSTSTLTNKTLTNPTINAATLGGAILFAENASVDLDPTLSADGTYSGICITGTAGTTLAFGDLIYLAVADSRWELVDADAVATCGAVLTGMCVLAAAADGNATKILLQGNIRADAAFPALTIGANVYAGLTPGDIVTTAPSATDDVVHVVGKALTADSIYFNPSPDYITIV